MKLWLASRSYSFLMLFVALMATNAPNVALAGFFGLSRDNQEVLVVTSPLPTVSKTAPQASKLELPAPYLEIAQASSGKVVLAQIAPVGWVVLLYEAPDGKLLPARVLNAQGDVIAAESTEASTVVWVVINEDGAAIPLQVDSNGSMAPARVNDAGEPDIPDGIDADTRVFAAQVSSDGDILPILRSLTDGLIEVVITEDGAVARRKGSTTPVAPKSDNNLSASVEVDNSGSGETGVHNVTAIVGYSDLWGADHNVSLGATASASEPDAYKSVFGSYSLPVDGMVDGLPDQLSVSGYYYDIDYDTFAPNQNQAAKFAINGYAISPSYTQYIAYSESPDGSQTAHGLTYRFSFDRYWTRDYGFGQDSRTSIVRMPLSLTYNMWHSSNFFGSGQASLGYTRNLALGPANDGADYRANRVRADPRYDKLNLFVSQRKQVFGSWHLNNSIKGQYSRDPLISSEGFALGGQYSVRGLESSRTIGDTGFSGQFEIETPDLLDGDTLEAHLISFVDAGWVDVRQSASGVASSETAVGIGGGAKFSTSHGIYANITAGWLAGGSAVSRYEDEDGRVQLYFNAGVNF